MTLEELAEYTRTSKRTIYRLLRQGKMTARRIGSELRFSKNDADRWMAAKRLTEKKGRVIPEFRWRDY